MNKLTVGKLAKIAGINLETIRYYERIGLLPQPARTESGYRIYGETDIKRLFFIKRAKELGFTLREINELLELRIKSQRKCGDVKRIAKNKIADIDRKIKDLEKLKSVLQKLVSQCINEQLTTEECPILETIELQKEFSFKGN